MAALTLLGGSVDEAFAGRFHVYTCRTPGGEAAPASGWSGSKTGSYTYTEDTCEAGGSLVAALGDQPARNANSDLAAWAFAPGAGETVVGATLWRAGDADGGQAAFAVYGVWFAGPENQNVPADAFGQCFNGPACRTGVGDTTDPLSSQNRLVVATRNLYGRLYFDAACSGESGNPCPEGQHDARGYAAVIYLYAADLTLEQTEGPSAVARGGELATASTVSGVSDLTFTATDPGAGVYQAVFTVDGHVVQSPVIDENAGRCRDVGQTTDGLPAFLYVQPCKPAVSADIGLDTTHLANGTHHLVVSVTDAAGNSSPVLDRNITVANQSSVPNPSGPGAQTGGGGQTLPAGQLGLALPSSQAGGPGAAQLPPNGTPASAHARLAVSWAGTRSARLVLPYGRAATAVGRLTAAGGTPIAGAQVVLETLPSYAGAASVGLKPVTTGPDGRFVVRLSGVLSSGTLRFSYREHLGDAAAANATTLALVVRAGVSLTVAPRSSSVGHTIRFHGLLRGKPIPRAGKQLVLEARSPGGSWLEFDVVRANAAGVYRASYRFHFRGPATYQFRVVSEPESDFPYAAGVSNVVVVHER